MLNYKLFRLLQILLYKELLDIEKYLAVPIFNPSPDVTRLFAQVCKFHPAFDSPKLTKARLYSKLFGEQPYNDGTMRKLMDVSRLERLGWKAKIGLEQGIRETYEWYLAQSQDKSALRE